MFVAVASRRLSRVRTAVRLVAGLQVPDAVCLVSDSSTDSVAQPRGPPWLPFDCPRALLVPDGGAAEPPWEAKRACPDESRSLMSLARSLRPQVPYDKCGRVSESHAYHRDERLGQEGKAMPQLDSICC
jgi:hypothetical protein